MSSPREALAWGRNGHDAVAAIAEWNLTPKAKATVESYLGGHSIVYYSSWMDNYRHTPEYKHSSQWHTAPVDDRFYHTAAVAREGGDAMTALDDILTILRDYKRHPDDIVSLNIKYLVHLLGDMHCPVHVKYTTIKTNFSVYINGKKSTYHSVWDGDAVATHKWGYLEWVHQMNRLDKDQIAKVTAGTHRDWFHENALDSRVIYEWARPDMKLDGNDYKDFINKAAPLAESQIQKAGYRLARILNDCFGQ
ncbi:hypothetical protein AW736_18990 [Termitidicoccus mucosus]|uniref:S1/P1 Nuclease n=1 Tax=Termitidicoccus mucosus TaxID=1184151 RepID=A0A178IEH8_9BACT|nr:hypothetical protein AW736_18990 [Opitutaceae bacterium TSB47]